MKTVRVSTSPDGPPAVDAEELFAGAREVRLRHRSDEYRLRLTRHGKLILTK